jgi:hypothetical protein
MNLTLLHPPSRIAQRLKNVLTLKIGVISEKFVNCQTSADLSYYHSDCNALATNAWLTPHHGRILRNAIKIAHNAILSGYPNHSQIKDILSPLACAI